MPKRDWYSNPTQIRWICDQLRKWVEISHLDEVAAVRGWRLAAVVHRLKREFDWPIVSDRRGPNRIAFYRLAPGTDLSALKMPPSALRADDDGEPA